MASVVAECLFDDREKHEGVVKWKFLIAEVIFSNPSIEVAAHFFFLSRAIAKKQSRK